MEEINQEQPEKIKGEQIKQIVFLILILIAIVALVAAIVTVHRYSDMLSNPLGYNLAKFNLNSCSCFDNTGKIVQFVATNKTI